MSRMEEAREGVRLDPAAVEAILRKTQASTISKPFMDVAGFRVQVTSPRERVRIHIDGRSSVDLDAVNARRLAVCLLFAASYVETPPPSAEETLAAVERTLSTETSPRVRLAEAQNIIREWRAEG